MKLDLSKSQISRLQKGGSVQIKPEQMGRGIDINLHPMLLKKLEKGYHAGKGTRIKLSEEEMVGSGIFGKKFDKVLKKAGVKKLAYKVGDAAKPFVKDALTTAVTGLSASFPVLAPALAVANGMASDYMDEPAKYQGGTIKSQFIKGLKRAGIKKDVQSLGKQLTKKNVRKGLKEVNSFLADSGFDSVQSQVAQKLTDNTAMQDAIIQRASTAIEGGAINPYLPTKFLGSGFKVRGGSIAPSGKVEVFDDMHNKLRKGQAGFVAPPPLLPNGLSFAYNPALYRKGRF